MISTFDLTLLGSFVSVGGILFLSRGKRLHFSARWLTGREPIIMSEESREQHQRSAALAGARWLTIGALTLFVGLVHGAEEGYLFGPWSDVMFHFVFVSTCWTTTAFRIKQTAARATATAVSSL